MLPYLDERIWDIFHLALVPEVPGEFGREAVVAPQPGDVARESAPPGADESSDVRKDSRQKKEETP